VNISRAYTVDKPPTEKELIRLQDEWILNKSDETLAPFFGMMITYTRSLTLKINRGKVYLAPSRVIEIATDAVLKVFEKYSADPGFKVKSSFAGQVKYPILELLYGSKQKKIDRVISLNSMISYDNDNELIDIQEKLKFTSISKSDYTIDSSKDLQEVSALIRGVFNEAKSILTHRQLLLFRTGLLLWVRRPKSRFAIPRFVKMFFSTEEEQVFEIFMLEIRNRIMELTT